MTDSGPARRRDDTAEVVAASWRKALNVSEVADDDDFFELGGNSIVVTRIVSQLRRELGIEVDMLQLWETSAFGEFRDVVEARLAGAEENSVTRGRLAR